MNIYDFKILIKAKKVPVNIDNKIINYIQDITMQNNHLFCEIYFKKTLIAQGIILDFYKEFEILEGFNKKLFTHILIFEYNSREYQSYTNFGKKIYEMKYLKNPPIKDNIRESHIDSIVSIFNGYIEYLKKEVKLLNISHIPSSSQIPEDIINKLKDINKIPLKNIITKRHSVQSKGMTGLSTQSLNKYNIDLSQLDTAYQYIIIDDVVGTGASLCEILYNLYNHNKKVNFFFIPVKDVKR